MNSSQGPDPSRFYRGVFIATSSGSRGDVPVTVSARTEDPPLVGDVPIPTVILMEDPLPCPPTNQIANSDHSETPRVDVPVTTRVRTEEPPRVGDVPVPSGLQTEDPPDCESWKLFVDGSACNKGSGISIVLISLEGAVLEQSLRLAFKASNNEAEYEALLTGLSCARTCEVKNIVVHCDSQLVVNQLSKEYDAKDDRMVLYVAAVRKNMAEFGSVEIVRISSSQNSHADALACLASSVQADCRRTVTIGSILKPSIEADTRKAVWEIELGPS